MGPVELAVVIAAVLLGCVLQRTSGMGTGLVVSPTLVLAIGPVSGVVLTNITTMVSATLMTIALRADVDRARLVRIAPVVIVGSLPAALLVRSAIMAPPRSTPQVISAVHCPVWPLLLR